MEIYIFLLCRLVGALLEAAVVSMITIDSFEISVRGCTWSALVTGLNNSFNGSLISRDIAAYEGAGLLVRIFFNWTDHSLIREY